ncbi:MAG: hypothetical protein DWQ19_11710 [Crenarchaeota archaeon]|mgnify:CR=1 FL=1|nr:MAG: hypothetical protein DWQ19_11710 [Thermoproteota archaeon]
MMHLEFRSWLGEHDIYPLSRESVLFHIFKKMILKQARERNVEINDDIIDQIARNKVKNYFNSMPVKYPDPPKIKKNDGWTNV